MKKRFIFFTLLLLTLIGGANWNVLNAQETVTIGSGTTSTDRAPICDNNYKYSISQLLYTSDEINIGAHTITHISFKLAQGASNKRMLDVYMKNTTKTNFKSSGDLENFDESFLVYSDNFTFSTVDGWVTIQLENPFQYDGSNLLICINDKTGASVTGSYDYDKFNTYAVGTETPTHNRCVYARNDNSVYDPSNLGEVSYSSVSAMDYSTWKTTYYNNQIKLTMIPTAPAEPSVTVSAESIALGDVRMGNYWTEKPAVTATVEVAYESTVAPTVTSDNEFFTVSYDASTSPFNLTIGYNKNASVTEEQTDIITITSGELEKTITVTAVPYTPATGDVWELAPVVDLSTGTFNSGEVTGMYDDYILPGEEAADGNLNDAVYKFELENDALITATVEGENPIVAIYDEDFGGEDGPSSDNNNTGVQSGPSAPTTFFYDFNDGDLSDFTLIDADGDGQNWYTGSNIYIGSISLLSDTKTSMNNRIVTKNKYSITNSSTLQFKLNSYYQEILGIEVSENGTAFEKVSENIYGAMYQSTNDINISLSEWAGKEVFIAIYHKKATSSGGYKVAIDNLALTDGSAKSRADENQIDGVQYPAGTYYLVAAAEGDFTLNLKKVDYIAIDAPQIEGGGSTLNKYVGETVTLEWSTVEGVDGYRVYNGEDVLAELEGGEIDNYTTVLQDYNVTPGYTFYVTAYIGENESPKSEPIYVKVTDYTTLNVTVKDANEKPIEGAKIVLQGKDEFGEDKNYNNLENGAYENGTYTLEVLLGTYTATITKLDYNDVVVEEVTLSYAQQSYTLDVVMQSKPSAPFTVYAEEGSASWEANYSSYNVYRRDSEGDVTSLATEVKANEYQDTKWETLADGEYEYGVSAMMVETNNITESFNTSSIPEGWTQNGTYTWNFNGATAYLYVYTSTSLQSNLTSPMIDLTGIASPKVTFKYCTYSQYGSSYSNTITVSVAESLDGAWTQIWSNNKKFTGYNTYENAEADLSNYSGKKVYVKFSSNINYCYSYIDDVVLPNATSSESRINWSAPVEKGGITFTGDGNWNTDANWNRVPGSTDKVTIKGNATITENVTVGSIRIASGATLTVKEGVVLNVTNGISNTNAAALVMEDGAQIIQTNSNVAATFNMIIANPTQGWGKNKDGWQFIASPLLNAKTSAFETSGEENDFDLYKYDGTKKGEEWVNYKRHKRVGDTFEHNFNDGSLNGWTNLDATYQWNIATGGINSTYCLTSANSGTSYIMSPKVLVEKGSKFYFTARVPGYSEQDLTVAVSETGNIDDMVTKLNVSANTWKWDDQYERYITLDEYAGKEVYIIISHTSTYGNQIAIDNLRLTNAGGESDGTFETEFVNGRAYLASYQAETTATFTGVLNNATSFDYEFAYDAEKDLANFHLLGNPFTFDMDLNNVSFDNVYEAFATVDPTTGGYIIHKKEEDNIIPVGDGFFVEAIGKTPSISYPAQSKSRGEEKADYINVVASGKQGSNNVIIKLSGKEEKGFSKLENLNQSIADIYVKNNGRQYSVLGYDNDVKEVELFFDAKEMGNYTIGIEPNGKFQSVTLVDRMTGAETNMLLDSYTFTATANDNPNRFVIRLANSQEPTANSNFVYQSGEELIVDAEGTIQIIDVMGRMVYSNDVESSNNRINVSNLKGATYIVRNISNNTVRTQKIVIL